VKRLENDGSPIAGQALRQIAELYAIEASVRAHAPETRLAARTKLAAPIIVAFRPWLEAQLSRIPNHRSWRRTSATRSASGRG
jgi:hypothetical protein